MSCNISHRREQCCTCFNHLNNADDCVLLVPCPAALQELVNICVEYAYLNEMLYNAKKSVCMAFLPPSLHKLHVPTVMLGSSSLTWVSDLKYLGVYIAKNYSDDIDIKRQTKAIYARGNTLIRKFSKCSPDVKTQLFNTYCSNLYASHLWHNYSKKEFHRVRVAYNNVFRALMSITRGCSISQSFVDLDVSTFNSLLRNYTNVFSSRRNT